MRRGAGALLAVHHPLYPNSDVRVFDLLFPSPGLTNMLMVLEYADFVT